MTKALQLARSFHAAGHRVILVESAKYRLHRAPVLPARSTRFYTVPQAAGPRLRARRCSTSCGARASTSTCRSAARRPATTTRWPSRCSSRTARSLHCDADTGRDARRQVRASPRWPRRSACRCPTRTASPTRQQVATSTSTRPAAGPYILKSIPYDPVHRLDLTPLPLADAEETAAFARSKPISDDNAVDPAGVRRRAGVLHAQHGARRRRCRCYCCCESSAFQINYEMVDKPEIEAWVRQLRRRARSSPARCRSTSSRPPTAASTPSSATRAPTRRSPCSTTTPDVAAAYLDDGVPTGHAAADEPADVLALPRALAAAATPGDAAERGCGRSLRGKDAIFDWADPLPFLHGAPPADPVAAAAATCVHGKDWIRIDFNIGKLVEPAGD